MKTTGPRHTGTSFRDPRSILGTPRSHSHRDWRYTTSEATYDWLGDPYELSDALQRLLPSKNVRILVLGCGNSALTPDFYDKGYRHIVSLDYSESCIEQMRKKFPAMQWVIGDIRELPFNDEAFDVLIDKATLDVMMTTVKDPWNPPSHALDDCRREIDEAVRVLRPGGVFLYVTWAQPHFRKPMLTRQAWTVEVVELQSEGFSHFLYVMRKNAPPSASPMTD